MDNVRIIMFIPYLPRQIGLEVSVSAFHAVSRGIAPRPGQTKDQHINGNKSNTECSSIRPTYIFSA